MSDFRIRYGLALGPYGSAGATSASHLITPGDTTPDVTLGAFFVTANTSATTITYFDVVGGGGVDSTANNGKVISILFQDNLTTIANAGQIFYAGTQAAFTSGQTVSFIYYNSAFYQYPVTADVSRIGRETVKTYVLTVASAALDVAGVSLAIITPSAGAVGIVGLSNGVIGQQVTLMKDIVSAGTALQLTSFANFQLAGTTAVLMNVSGAYTFFCDNGTRFRSVAGLIAP